MEHFEFTGESLTREVLRECRILCVGGFGLNPKLSGANVRRAFRIARELGFSGTPGWVVGNQTIDGAVGYDQLRAAIVAARAG